MKSKLKNLDYDKIYITFLAFSLVLVAIWTFLLSYDKAFASTYTRTPADVLIDEGVSVNFVGHMEAPTVDISSYQITLGNTDVYEGFCVDNGIPLDEWDYDITFSAIPAGVYSHVHMYTYTNSTCDNTGGETDDIVLESGSPAFEVVAIPQWPSADSANPEETLETKNFAISFAVLFLVFITCAFSTGIIINKLT